MSNIALNSILEDFIKLLQNQIGLESDNLLKALQSDSYTSIRVNNSKKIENFIDREKISWCEEGFYLKTRPNFTIDPLFHAGCFYVQESSSMFLAHIIKEIGMNLKKINVLDLCAAPGGKSTLLLDNITDDSLLVCNEVIKSRAQILRQNIIKWGKSNVLITNNDPVDFQKLSNFFDLIVVDAPCSGEGMFRKDKNARNEWSLENVNLCASRQKRIVHDVFQALKPGGFFIYSTCTFNESENMENVRCFLKELPISLVKININESWGIKQLENGCFQFYPHLTKGEGFFCAVFQKNEVEISNVYAKKVKPKYDFVSNSNVDILKKWVNTENLDFLHINQGIHAIPVSNIPDISLIMSKLYCIHAGTMIGEIINSDCVPSHDLALSNIISKEIQSINVDLNSAIQYLKRNDISNILNEFVLRKSWFLVNFQETNIGFAKNIGNRINNYYPKELRILKDF